MKWFENLIRFLFPTVVLAGTPWEAEWEDTQRQTFNKVARIFFLSVAIGYVSHYFIFDLANNLQPIEMWLWFRMSIAAMCVASLAFYLSPLANTRLYKVPALIASFVLCYSQARVTVWYSEAPWIYNFVFVLACVFLLRSTALKSLAFATAAISVQTPSMLEAGVAVSEILSGSFVTLGITVVTRAAYASDVENFLLNRERDQANQSVIDLSREFSDRVQSFIPRVIASRLQDAIDRGHASVLEATVEVLKAEKKDIACLFSDIRGFTQGSKELREFVNESVLPEVKACSDAIEYHGGIPRKIGDLIFAYFDENSMPMNVLRATMAGMTISRLNADINETLSQKEIRRYILISSGEAIVGNVGGLDSSVEITALGSPVNFLSRLDDATKLGGLAELLEPGDLVLCEQSARVLMTLGISMEMEEISLREVGVSIRDFPEANVIYRIRPSDRNYELLLSPYNYVCKKKYELSSMGYRAP